MLINFDSAIKDYYCGKKKNRKDNSFKISQSVNEKHKAP